MANNPIRILIVDDHAVVRRGLIMVLRLEPEFEVVGEAENGRVALKLAKQLQPDLVLLDFAMPEMDGVATAKALQASMPAVRILILSGVEVDDRVLDLLASGIDGYVIKDIEPDELAQAIRTVARGEAYLHPTLTRRILNRMHRHNQVRPVPEIRLTPREQEVLRWMSTASTYRDIAGHLYVSEETIRSHAKRILSKLNQPNRAQAVLEAVRIGILELPE